MNRKYKLVLSFSLLKQNIKSILLFELLFKMVSSAIIIPILYGLFHLSLSTVKLTYLSNDNLQYYLTRPSTIIFIIIFIFAFLLYTIFEISCFISCYQASYYKQKISVHQMLSAGTATLLKIFKGNNISIFGYTFCLIPLINLSIIFGYVSSISLPSFFINYLQQNLWVKSLIGLLFILFLVEVVRFIYAFPIFVLEKDNFHNARKQSLKMNHKSYLKNCIGIIVWNITVLVLLFATAVLSTVGTAIVIRLFSTSRVAYSLALGVAAGAITIILIIFSNFMVPIAFAYTSAMYIKYRFDRGEEIPAFVPKVGRYKKTGKVVSVIIVLSLVLNLIYVTIGNSRDFLSNVQLLNHPTVTAHRGDSYTAPENTIPAIQQAINNHADYVEIDVQQTKDGEIILMHDTSLKRTTGLRQAVWNTTYEQIAKLDAGAWFSRAYINTKVPTLKEAIEVCKNKIDMNIELKPSGHDRDFEQKVVDLILEAGIEKECVVASMSYNSIKKVKELAPQIQTVYVTSVAYGWFDSLEYADIVSIEASFLTSKLVNQLHENKKRVYAWTVNDTAMVQTLIDLGVDSIITDDPVMVRESIYSKDLNQSIVDFILGMFR